MAITSIKTGSSFTNLIKYNDFLAGNTAFSPSSFESIATVTVGSGGSSSIEFTSIPSTYTHLQIRGIVKWSDTSDDRTLLKVEYNSDTGSNYARHLVGGNGSGAFVDGVASTTARAGARIISSNASYANMFTAYVMDILDYTNTNKYTTTRTLGGFDTNGGSFQEIVLGSFLWQNTAAITTIKLLPGSANFTQYSQFALYGIKS
jgi:hypothetical protein